MPGQVGGETSSELSYSRPSKPVNAVQAGFAAILTGLPPSALMRLTHQFAEGAMNVIVIPAGLGEGETFLHKGLR